MSKFNYCLVQTNKIYEQIQDMLDLEEISMNNPNDNSKIFYHLEKIVSKAKFINSGERKGLEKLAENIKL